MLELLVLGLRPVIIVTVVGGSDSVLLEVEAHLLHPSRVMIAVAAIVIGLWVARCRRDATTPHGFHEVDTAKRERSSHDCGIGNHQEPARRVVGAWETKK